MPPLRTARNHFDEDISRARVLNDHANTLGASLLRDDIARASWMIAVGAADAYFCDAYADLCARSLQAKQIQDDLEIPDKILNLQIPAIAAIRPSPTENWRWRMAARGMIETQSVLSIEKVKELFNRFCRDKHKVFCDANFDSWVTHSDATQRLFGISRTRYRALNPQQLSAKRTECKRKLENRFATIFQRRHDCIHNCDRPKIAIVQQGLNHHQVSKIVVDITFLVHRFHETMAAEFPEWIRSIGTNAATKNRVLQ